MKKFTEEELISFGNYLLSPYRIENLMSSPDYDEELLAERMEYVCDADIRHWVEISKTPHLGEFGLIDLEDEDGVN